MDNDNLAPNRNGSTEPFNNLNDNIEPNTRKTVDGSEPIESKPVISEKRVRANRENSKKSTGPKTERGKANSRRNALKHGLLSKLTMCTPDGLSQDDGLQALREELTEKYGSDDVRTELLVEMTVLEYWRIKQSLEHEVQCLGKAEFHFSRLGNMSNLQRYRTASQRALLKNLELLDDMQLPTADVGEEAAEDDVADPES